jgi:hypothetical protein
MKSGDIVKNFELVEQINTINDFILEIDNKPSIFWRHRVHPSTFFLGWPLRLIRETIAGGHFWTVQKIENNK